MTTKRTYECNFCRGTISDTGNIGRGLKWAGSGLAWDACSQTENHLCDCCVNSLMALFRGSKALNPDKPSPIGGEGP